MVKLGDEIVFEESEVKRMLQALPDPATVGHNSLTVKVPGQDDLTMTFHRIEFAAAAVEITDENGKPVEPRQTTRWIYAGPIMFPET